MMSHRYTTVEIIPRSPKIEITDGILTLGSCFSDHIGGRLTESGFDTLVNPLGIIYNPISLSRSLDYIRDHKAILPISCDHRGEVHFHYDFHSQLSALTVDDLCQNISTEITKAHKHLSKTKWLLITLGTSIVHDHKVGGATVANCHKMPKDNFDKRMLTIDESYDTLVKVLDKMDGVEAVLTVSPIRHTREGMIQNQRSKSRLVETAYRLSEHLDYVSYFPAYEIVMDELRDYRYYQQDMIHPTVEAIDIVWDRFQKTYLSPVSLQKVIDISKYTKSIQHQPQFPDSVGHRKFTASLVEMQEVLKIKYPEVDF